MISTANITNWTVLHRLRPQFLHKVRDFLVLGENGTDVLLITKDDRIFAYGTNETGCLGLGNKQQTNEPIEIGELNRKSVRMLVNGLKHVLALTESGEIYSWGDNNYGQLGNMNTFESLRPTLVGKQIVSVDCGANHTLALTKTGQVFAWGRNNYGQIGLGNNNNQLIPAKVSELEPYFVTAIACGGSHSLALTENGQLWSWGNNSFGQLGIGNCTHQTLPNRVTISSGGGGSGGQSQTSNPTMPIKSIACGANHSLVLMQNGEIYSFGRNDWGQLGVATVPVSEGSCSPVRIPILNRFRSISAHFASNLSVALSQCDYCFVWGELANELGPVREPRETPLSSVVDTFAIYSKRRNTPPASTLLILNPDIDSYESTDIAIFSSAIKHCRRSFVDNIPGNRIIAKLSQRFNDPEGSDLEFVIDGRSIYVHRWFLQISSKYFDRMLSDEWLVKKRVKKSKEEKESLELKKENGETEGEFETVQLPTVTSGDESTTTAYHHRIEITDSYSYQVYYAYFRYLYTDCLDLDGDGQKLLESALELLDLANCYLEDDLHQKCIKILRQEITVENCCTLYQIATQYGLKQFEQFVVTFVLNHLFGVCRSDGFHSMSEQLCKSLLISVGDMSA